MLEHTNFEALNRSIDVLTQTKRYENRKLDFSEAEKSFNQGAMAIMLLDNSKIYGTQNYAGHFVTITKINQTHVVYHDTGGTPNRAVEKEKFLEAWNAKGTDNDIIIIKGKK